MFFPWSGSPSGRGGVARAPEGLVRKSVSVVSDRVRSKAQGRSHMANSTEQKVSMPPSAESPAKNKELSISSSGAPNEFNVDAVLDAAGIGDPAVFRTPPVLDYPRPVPRLSCAVRRAVKDALLGWTPSAKELRTLARSFVLWNGTDPLLETASALCLASRQEVRRPRVSIACAALVLLMDLEWVVDPDAGAPVGGDPTWPAGTAGYLLVHGPLRGGVAGTPGPVGDLVRLAKSQRLTEPRCSLQRLRQLESMALTAIDAAEAAIPQVPDGPVSEPPTKEEFLLIELADGSWKVAFGGASATFPSRFQGLRAFRTLIQKQREEVPTIELDSDSQPSYRPRVTEAVASDVLEGSERGPRDGERRDRAEDQEQVRRARQAIRELRERGETERADEWEVRLARNLDYYGRLRPPQDDVGEQLGKRVSKAVKIDLPRRLRARGLAALADHVEAHVTIGRAFSSYMPPKPVPWRMEPGDG